MSNQKITAKSIDEREKEAKTFLQQTYAAQEERDNAAHEAAVKAQETARKAANREAYVGNELLQKYLPQYQAMQGTAGMGTSATDAMAAYNAYLGRVSGNNANYAQNVAALDQQKAEVDYQRDAAKREKEFQIKDTYDAERLDEANVSSDSFLNQMASRYDVLVSTDGKISQEDYDSLAAFYKANEARLTDAGKQSAADMLEGYQLEIRDEDDQKAMDRYEYINKGVTLSRGLSAYDRIGNNFWVKDENGKEYAVEIGDKVGNKDVLSQAGKADSGEVFAYGGKLYIKSGSDVYEVEQRERTKQDEYKSLYDLYFGSGKSGT